jgi:hypothetical protein
VIERRFAHLEFQARVSSPAAIAKSIRSCGCALVRGALSPTVMAYLGDVMPLMFRYIDVRETYAHYKIDQAEPPKPFRASLVRFDVLPGFSKMIELEVIDFLFGAIDRSVLTQVNLEYFPGQVFGLRSKMSIARRQGPVADENSLPFHQDGANYVDLDFLNFWIPATPAGGDAPGLELVPVALDETLAVTTGPSAYPTIELDEASLAARFGRDSFFHPVMQPGDVLIMNQHTVHRTYTPPGATRERFSFEVRVGVA